MQLSSRPLSSELSCNLLESCPSWLKGSILNILSSSGPIILTKIIMYYALVIIESGKLEPTHGNHQNRHIFRSDCCKAPDQLHSFIANFFNIPKFIHFVILNVILCNFENKSVNCEEVIITITFYFSALRPDWPEKSASENEELWLTFRAG